MCECTNCTSTACCGNLASGSWCEGKTTTAIGACGKQANYCYANLPSPCQTSGDPWVYNTGKFVLRNGLTLACIKQNGSYNWHQACNVCNTAGVANVCDYICSAPYSYQAYCEASGAWNTTPSTSTCNGGTVPPAYLCP